MADSQKNPVQLVEEGKKRLEALSVRRTRARTLLETERKRLEEARCEAGVEYGVDSLEGLRALHAQRNAQNEAAAAAFLAALSEAETRIEAVEAHLAA